MPRHHLISSLVSIPAAPCCTIPSKMHLLLLLLSTLGCTLASPLSFNATKLNLAIIEKFNHTQFSANKSCPADPVKEVEKIIFDYSKSRVDPILPSTARRLTRQPHSSDRRIRKCPQHRLTRLRRPASVPKLAFGRLHHGPRQTIRVQLQASLPSPVST